MFRNKLSCFLFFYLLTSYTFSDAKKAIVIGATSGIGREVAKQITQDGYEVGIVGRRIELLETFQQEFPSTFIKQIDVTSENAQTQLAELIEEMGGLDLIVISISAYHATNNLTPHEANKLILNIDLLGFYAMAEVAIAFFEQQKSGHIVGISSIDGLRGNALCPVYSGAKAFLSTYLEGIRNKMIQNKIPIHVSDIYPGWVDVEHTKFSEMPGTYWVVPLQKAGKQIYNAIKKKKKRAYVSKRWRIIAWLLALTPDWIYNKIGGF